METTVVIENGHRVEKVNAPHSPKKGQNRGSVNKDELSTELKPPVVKEPNGNPIGHENGSSDHPVTVEDVRCELQDLDIQIPSTSGYSNANTSKSRIKLEFESSDDEDHSHYEATVSQNFCDVSVVRDRPSTLNLQKPKRHLVKISPNEISSPDSPLSENEDIFSPETDSQDDVDNSIVEMLNSSECPEKIPELTLAEERAESKSWKVCTVAGVKRTIDMKVIEPYKRVLSHGGYLNTGSHNAIITFSACFLPHKSRKDYNYVMDNLFFYIIYTLNQLVTDDYVLVYLHGGTAKDCIPKFSWLKRCYQLIDRKLRKNLKALYLVHTTFWLRTLVTMIKPFISSKFSRKLHFINSLAELNDVLPIEEASIPDKVKQYDRIKSSLQHK